MERNFIFTICWLAERDVVGIHASPAYGHTHNLLTVMGDWDTSAAHMLHNPNSYGLLTAERRHGNRERNGGLLKTLGEERLKEERVGGDIDNAGSRLREGDLAIASQRHISQSRLGERWARTSNCYRHGPFLR